MLFMELIDTKTAGEELGVTPQHVIRLLKKHKLGRKMSKQWVLTRDDVDALRKILDDTVRGNPDFGTKYKGSFWRKLRGKE